MTAGIPRVGRPLAQRLHALAFGIRERRVALAHDVFLSGSITRRRNARSDSPCSIRAVARTHVGQSAPSDHAYTSVPHSRQ